jgi:hypothetical protein
MLIGYGLGHTVAGKVKLSLGRWHLNRFEEDKSELCEYLGEVLGSGNRKHKALI